MIKGMGRSQRESVRAQIHWYRFHPADFIRECLDPFAHKRKIPVNVNLPDRLSIDKDSPHYDPVYKKVGVRLNGKERDNVYEYCVSQGWARVIAHGNKRGRDGKILTFKITGTVEPYLLPEQPQVPMQFDHTDPMNK